MGLPMARHLLQAGYQLTVYNRTRARADELKQFHPVVADSPVTAGRDAEVLVTMVADDAALEDAMLGPHDHSCGFCGRKMDPEGLFRPGQEGWAKISLGKRPLAYVLLSRAWDHVRLWWWRLW